MRLRREQVLLGLILLVALALRLGYVFGVVGDDPAQGDAIYYSAQAEVLTRGDGFAHPFTGEPAADHPPMTALLLALPSVGGGDPLFEQRIFMALLGTLAVAAIAALGRELGGPRAAVGAGVVAALYPGLWINDGLAMSETPTALVTALLVLTTIRWWRDRAPSWLVGVVGGFAVLTRAELGLLLALIVVPRVVSTHTRAMAAKVAIVVVAAIAIVTPWTVRNLTAFEDPVLISTNDGLTLLGSNCDPSYNEGLGFWHLQCAGPVAGDQSQVSAAYRDQAVTYIREHRDELPRVLAARLGRMASVYRPMDMVYLNQGEGRPQTATRLAIWAWWFLVPAGAVGLWCLRRRRGPWLLLLMPAVAVVTVTLATYGIPRFRVPMEVALIAAVGVIFAGRPPPAGGRAKSTHHDRQPHLDADRPVDPAPTPR